MHSAAAGAMKDKRCASQRLACKLLVLTQAILLMCGCSAFKGYPERATDPSTDLDKLRPDIEASAFYYYPNSAWLSPLWVGGYNFETPPPEVSADGVITVNPPTGARTLNARPAFFFYATYITPAMIMRLTGIGSQYLGAFVELQRRILRRRQDLQDDASAKGPRGKVLVPDPLRQPDALDARHAAALPARRQPELSDARRRTERRRLHDRVLQSQAARRRQARQLDFRPRPARAGTRSCVSTARSSRSSPRSGGRVRSSW